MHILFLGSERGGIYVTDKCQLILMWERLTGFSHVWTRGARTLLA
jgi:hypothetical protein